MKKTIAILGSLFFASVILFSCGEEKTEKEKSVRKMNAKLDTLVTDLASCESINSNCDAYKRVEDGIREIQKDTSVKNLVDDLFNGIAQSTKKSRSVACAYIIYYWVSGFDQYKKPAYGHIVLNAIKKEKFDDTALDGSMLGLLLGRWIECDDKTLVEEICATIKNKKTPRSIRTELIRFADLGFDKPGFFELLIRISKDENEHEDARTACINTLWRVNDPKQYATVENLYLTLLKNPSPTISGYALQGLGNMRSVKAYDQVLSHVEKIGVQKENYSYACNTLQSYIGYDKKEGIDAKKAFLLTVKMTEATTLLPYQRSCFIYAIEAYGGKDAEKALTTLSSHSEKDISEIAKQALERLKNKQQ